MRRRNFIAGLASTTASWPLTAYAQHAVLPVVGLIRDGSADTAARYVAAFRKGLNETGYVEGQNVNVEYHWLEGRYDHLPALLADLVRRQVTVIATPGQVVSRCPGHVRFAPKSGHWLSASRCLLCANKRYWCLFKRFTLRHKALDLSRIRQFEETAMKWNFL
jgi:hypothetical protein